MIKNGWLLSEQQLKAKSYTGKGVRSALYSRILELDGWDTELMALVKASRII